MFTIQDPSHCPKCQSKNIYLEPRLYKKDNFGKDTDIVILGMWLCSECGNILGRKMNQYENDIDANSI
ncbi:MAG: hypothetical protein HDQ98_01065 [Lachnospiraceae bacterium]|nr:hypothetical protein [Lachnospiraceae bacterium]